MRPARQRSKTCSNGCKEAREARLKRLKLVQRIEREIASYAPEILSDPFTAAHKGTCPLEGDYIVPGRSTLVCVPPCWPMAFVYSDEAGNWTNHRGDPVSMKPHKWAHAKCAERAVKKHARKGS